MPIEIFSSFNIGQHRFYQFFSGVALCTRVFKRKRDDVEVKLLLTISEALNHNFFEDIYPCKKSEDSIDSVFDALKELVAERLAKE